MDINCRDISRRTLLTGVAVPGALHAAFAPAMAFTGVGSLRSVASPREFGAVGDGIADDGPAILAAIRHLDSIGGGVLEGEAGKVYRLEAGLVLKGVRHITLRGRGARLFRYTAGTASNALTLIGCSDIAIEDWDISSNYDGFKRGSTGSNPNILLGVAEGSLNRNITIAGNRFLNGNHANITIGSPAIDHLIPAEQFCNESIMIRSNMFANAGSAVFVYKGARNVRIENNVGRNFSSLGIAVDTHAAGSDPDKNAYRIENVRISDNKLYSIRAIGAFQGRGLTLKGGIFDLVVSNNIIEGVSSATNQPTFGIALTEDQSPSPATGAIINIVNNIVKNVSSSAGTGAWALLVNKNFRNVLVEGNTFDTAARGCLLSDLSEWIFRRNTLINLAISYGTPVSVAYGGRASPYTKVIEGNRIRRGAGASSIAIGVLANSSKVRFIANDVANFRTAVLVGKNVRDISGALR